MPSLPGQMLTHVYVAIWRLYATLGHEQNDRNCADDFSKAYITIMPFGLKSVFLSVRFAVSLFWFSRFLASRCKNDKTLQILAKQPA